MLTISLAFFLIFMILGMPVVFVLGIAGATAVVFGSDIPTVIISQRIFSGLNSFTIMAIPFFVFAGATMEAGGLSRRIVEFALAIVGWVTGSLYMVSVMAATVLAAISGSGSADAAAVSSIMQPEFKKRGYDTDFAAGLIAASSSLAQVIPPSLLLVIVAAISSQSTGALFIGGIVPGLVAAIGLLIVAFFYAKKEKGRFADDSQKFAFPTLNKAFWAALPALMMPVIIVGGIISGIFTATEAAAVAAAYSLLIGAFVYKDLKIRDLYPAIIKTICLSAAVMLIIGTANVFGWLIASAQVADKIAMFLQALTSNPIVFLLLINGLFLFIGMFMESIAAILILLPIFLPIAIDFGIDPIHFGVMVVFNLAIGMFTPPYGITLFVCASIAERSLIQVSRRIAKPFLVMLAVLLATTYYPSMVLYLPTYFGLIN